MAEGASPNNLCPKPVDDDWFEKVDQSKEIRTKLHFYFHDNATGEHQSVWVVAKSEITHISPTNFGLIYMVDNLMTVGPEPSSEVLGRVQGSPGFADLNNTAFALGLNFVFTEGKYKGSSICVLGRNPVLEKVREVPIVGGTGVFRMARGIAITSTYFLDEPNNNVILEYTLYVTHYSD
ncbi:hypothetical protein DH2020_010225 [Rehmannia glutinosa]|uniref:Dirigent protein n=1 Tax=Rehmannia glutinosa TaxID=99300 RepID=A0ABR0X8J1_REHGL